MASANRCPKLLVPAADGQGDRQRAAMVDGGSFRPFVLGQEGVCSGSQGHRERFAQFAGVVELNQNV